MQYIFFSKNVAIPLNHQLDTLLNTLQVPNVDNITLNMQIIFYQFYYLSVLLACLNTVTSQLVYLIQLYSSSSKKTEMVIYRTRIIALSSVISKVFENVILYRLEEYLWTTNNQFGYKAGHSTDLCVYALTELIEYFKRPPTSVCVAFLEASKDFD